MKNSVLFALVAALPLFAQDAAPAPAPSVPATAVQPARHHRPQMTEEQKAAFHAKMLEKFDTNKDGQLDDAEKEAMKAEFMKHHQGQPGKPGMHRPHGPRPEGRPAAAPAEPCNCGCNEGKPCECKQHKHEGKPGMHGPRHPQHPQMTEEQKAAFRAKMLEKFDTNKDGQLDDAEKEAMKAEFMKHHQGQPGMRRPHGPRPEGRPAPAPAKPCNCGCNEGKPCECGDNCKDAKPAAAPCNCGCNEGKPCQCGDNCKAA